MKHSKLMMAWLGSMALAGAGLAQEAESKPNLTAGGDFRLRQEYFDHIPIRVDPPGETRGGLNNYMRFRTRLWARYDLNDNIGVYGRVANEFRHYFDPDNETWDFPDEVIVDNLYLDVKKLLSDESLSLRIGRQDLFFMPGRPFGNGRLLLEGTPKDGSRTIYFDAVRATWVKGDATVDLLGIYNQHKAGLLILNDQDRDLTGFTSADNNITESGAGIYTTYKGVKNLGLELYYFFKNESQGMNGTNKMARLELSTIGGRLMPTFNDMFSGNLELAYQLGDRQGQDVSGYMIDALVKCEFLKESAAKPWASIGVLCLSGNDPSTGDDEGWNPLWARYPQWGSADLLAYSYDADGAARWSNLTLPYVSAGLTVTKDSKFSAMLGQLSANENDGPGTGKQRGLYAGAKVEITLAKGALLKKDELKGHLAAEIFDPGNYYMSGRDTACFLRWELAYSF